MILPNQEYPIQVSKPFKEQSELGGIISWMKKKNQDFIVAQSKVGDNVIFRKFDDMDGKLTLKNGIDFISWTKKLLDERADLLDYKILATFGNSCLTK